MKITGEIVKIGEVKELSNGAKTLTYRFDTGEEWNNLYEFEMYKKPE